MKPSLWILTTAALTACGPGGNKDDDTTLDGYGCLPDETVALTDLDAVPEAFSASPQATIDLMTGAFSGDVAHLETTVPATLTVTSTGRASLVRRSWHDDGGQELDATLDTAGLGACPDILTLPAVFALTADSALDLGFDADIVVTPAGAASFQGAVDFADIGGTATPAGFDPAEMDKTTLRIDATASESDAWTGDLAFQGEDSQPGSGGNDGTASATQEEWGTFTLVKP